MYDIIYTRLAQSSDVIFVLGMFIILLIGVLIYIYKRSEKKEEVNKKSMARLINSSSKKLEERNDDLLKALIDNTSAMVALEKSQTELRNDLKDDNN